MGPKLSTILSPSPTTSLPSSTKITLSELRDLCVTLSSRLDPKLVSLTSEGHGEGEGDVEGEEGEEGWRGGRMERRTARVEDG